MPLAYSSPLIKVSRRNPFGIFDARDYGLVMRSTVDNYEALQEVIYAASVSTDTRRGSTIILPNMQYYIGTGLEAPRTNRGLRIRGVGTAPGGAAGINARPVSIVSDQAIDLLTLGDSSNVEWTGVTIENISFADISVSNNQVLSGVKLIRQNNVRLNDVNFHQIKNGYAVYAPNVVGAGGGPQYVTIDNINTKDCKFGIYQDDTVTTADWNVIGGVIDGDDATSGSIGIRQGNAGSMRVIGTNVQHHENDWDLFRNTSIIGGRSEGQGGITARHINVRDGGHAIHVVGLVTGGNTPSSEHMKIGTGCENIYIWWSAAVPLILTDNSDCAIVISETYIKVPRVTDSSRPTAEAGMIVFNEDDDAPNFGTSTGWELGDGSAT